MESPAPSAGNSHNRSWFRARIGLILLSAGVLCITAVVWHLARVPSAELLLTRARIALARGRFAEAEQLGAQVATAPDHGAAGLLVAGEAALKQSRLQDAVTYFDRVSDDGSETAVKARVLTGDVLLNGLHRLAAAEQQLRRAIAQDPANIGANQHLAYLLGLCGRTWEATFFRMELLRQGAATPTDLLLLGLRDTARENTDVVVRYATRSPDDPLAQLGAAVAALGRRQTEQAEQLLRAAIATAPELVEAHVRLCGLLLERGRIAEFHELTARLPGGSEEHPEFWALRGDAAREEGDLRGAIRCFWESLKRDPCHQRACYQAAQLLTRVGEPGRAAVFTRRSVLLEQMLLVMRRLRSSPPTATARDAAELCEAAGLLWEAAGWSRLALSRNPRQEWAQQVLGRLSPQLTADLPRTLPTADSTHEVDLSDFPLPAPQDAGNVVAQIDAQPRGTSVAFADQAASAGLVFTYFNGSSNLPDSPQDSPANRPATPGPRVFEFTGGGVGVLDFDGDGWPDVCLTQGCHWPQSAGQRTHLDRLFRNSGFGQFEEITELAGLIEDRFSQGVTVGDYDGDGYPDLYVANLGPNRLYHNQGDGTFQDVTDKSGTGGDRWTTSCLLADLNGDTLPDLYAVNYLAGDDLFERICKSGTGKPISCTPHEFAAAQDQFYLNLGDGRFGERTDTCGIAVPDGKGLGIVAADFAGTGQLSLFVANDTVANFFFVNDTPGRGAEPVFREQAVVSGLAFDRDGHAQACMGIAVDDANADGRLDLFVTNYYDESNTLYLQQPGGQYRDATAEAGLREPSLLMLGFGTQFLDGELDGFPDLIAVNGHVSDLRDEGIPWRMRPQYFRNCGGGRFEEVRGESPGPWFEQESLGRGLTRLDWNRDGREDFVVTHLDSPAGLLTNVTSAVGHCFALQLRGVRSSRDALGATVRVTSGGNTLVRQLTGGDGYQASNQRQLIFGLGENQHPDEVVIEWPSGLRQQFRPVPGDFEFLVIEGRSPLVRIPQ